MWQGMRARCSNPKYKQYKDYGGRGIRVCSRWDDFWKFVQDMGTRPLGHVIDRINNDGNYEPGNCRWVSYRVSGLNRRRWGRTSQFRGVHLDSETGKWRAQVTFHGKKFIVGRFNSEKEAYLAYLNKRKELEPEE